MKSSAKFWDRVQQIIDNRDDPLDDPAVREYLLENPDDLEELAAMRAYLESLSTMRVSPFSGPTPRKQRATRIALLAAALFVSVSLLVFWSRTSGELDARRNLDQFDTSQAAVEGAADTRRFSAGVVLDYEMRIVESGPGFTNTLLATKDGWISRKTRVVNRADINGAEVITEEKRYGTIDPGLLETEPAISTAMESFSNWSHEDE